MGFECGNEDVEQRGVRSVRQSRKEVAVLRESGHHITPVGMAVIKEKKREKERGRKRVS